ncbi:arabinosyltransferase C-terminal domain-containing protein, partial [Bacteroides fragilis]|nr:arabinosyltransferase C-terminal domain-containing protein [Bacteroides fragilis]
DEWLAFTPPRVPELATINSQFDSQTPALLDWSVALQFPCQRTFDHYAGVTDEWLAFTPPRVPELATINSQFDSQTPALLDWSV